MLTSKLRFMVPLAVLTAVTMTLIDDSSASEEQGFRERTLVYATCG